jgi:putative methionine-R-sulfoxide reductase with GAF domain
MGVRVKPDPRENRLGVLCVQNYIACDAETQSEIVVPVYRGTGDDRTLFAVLDLDSDKLAAFDDTDKVTNEFVGSSDVLSTVFGLFHR